MKRVALTAMLFAAAVASWQWMRRNRVWETNHKEFEYPESWVEPDLHSDEPPLPEESQSTPLEDEIPPV